MNDLEREIVELKAHIESLKESNIEKITTISKLNSIGVSLATQKDVSSILQNILINIKEFTNADGGTIYLAYGSKLTFKHILNDTLKVAQHDSDDIDGVWNYLELHKNNENMIAVNCAINKTIIKIDDIDSCEDYDFSGTKAFEKKTGYKSKSMLVIPMLGDEESLVGVLQLINKQDILTNEPIAFTQDDVNIAHSLASQASVAVYKFQQDAKIIQQSKMAAMGEMIDAIAHQWKQPLNTISIGASKLEMDLEFGFEIDNNSLFSLATTTQKQVRHLIDTLDEFRSFLRPDKPRETISISKLIESVLVLIYDDLISNSIKVNIEGDKTLTCRVVINEVKHIFINLINNAKDAFIDNKSQEREITFVIEEKKGFNSISIIDNAGGIPEDIIKNIFKANFTTKAKGKGTGIGLYMSTQIAEKNDGELTVSNVDSGTKFILKLENRDEELLAKIDI